MAKRNWQPVLQFRLSNKAVLDKANIHIYIISGEVLEDMSERKTKETPSSFLTMSTVSLKSAPLVPSTDLYLKDKN